MPLETLAFPWRKDNFLAITSLIAACLCTISGGVVYTFSLYGPQIGLKLGYSSVQLNVIAISGNMGVFLSSPFFGYLADTQPPHRITKISAILYIFGFTAMALTYDGVLIYRNFFFMAFYYFLVGTASGCAYINATSTSGHNFKERRGLGIGLPVTFFGLSAFFFSLINHAFFIEGKNPDTSGFLKFVGIFTSLLTLVASNFLVKVNSKQFSEESRLLSEPVSSYGTCEPIFSNEATRNSSLIAPSLDRSPEQDIGGWDLFSNRDAQMLFVCILIIGGAGLVYINNVGTILHTLELVGEVENLPRLQSLSVSLLSISNCSGRLLFTVTSDWLSNLRTPIRRINWLFASALIIASIQLATGYSTASFIVMCSIVLGFGYGIMFAVAPTMTSVWFGTKHFGSNWGWMNVAPALGGQLLSLLFGAIYDLNLAGGIEDGNLCKLGAQCYRLTFQITSTLCFTAAILAFCLKKRRDHHC